MLRKTFVEFLLPSFTTRAIYLERSLEGVGWDGISLAIPTLASPDHGLPRKASRRRLMSSMMGVVSGLGCVLNLALSFDIANFAFHRVLVFVLLKETRMARIYPGRQAQV